MTHDEKTFFQAISENPGDAPRLVYADWLEEHGQPERAELIRVQCRLPGLPEDHPQRAELEAREQGLLEARQDEWLGPLGRWAIRWTFRRGFLAEVTVPARVYLNHRDSLALLAPLAQVAVDLGAALVSP